MATNEAKYKITAEDRTKRAIESASKGFKGLDGAVKGLTSSMGGWKAIATLTITTLTALTVKAAQSADQIDKLSKQIGVSAKEFQKLKFIGERSGVSVEQLTTAIATFQKNIVDAKNGVGEAQLAIKRLGLDAEELAKMTPTEALMEFSEALRGISTDAERTNISMRVLGEGGRTLGPLLQEGASGVEEMSRALDQIGGGLEQGDIDDFVALKDAWTDLAFVATNMLQEALAELAPLLTALIDGFRILILLPIKLTLDRWSGYFQKAKAGLQSIFDPGAWDRYQQRASGALDEVLHKTSMITAETDKLNKLLEANGQIVKSTSTPEKQDPLGMLLKQIETTKAVLNERLNMGEGNFILQNATEIWAKAFKDAKNDTGVSDEAIQKWLESDDGALAIVLAGKQLFNEYQRETIALQNSLEEMYNNANALLREAIKTKEQIIAEGRRITIDERKRRVVPEPELTGFVPEGEDLIAGLLPDTFNLDPGKFDQMFRPAVEVTNAVVKEIWMNWKEQMRDSVLEFGYSLSSSFGEAIRTADKPLKDLANNFGDYIEQAFRNAMARLVEQGIFNLFLTLLSQFGGAGTFLAIGRQANATAGNISQEWFGGRYSNNNMSTGMGTVNNVQFQTVLPPSREDIRRAQYTLDEIAIEKARFAF